MSPAAPLPGLPALTVLLEGQVRPPRGTGLLARRAWRREWHASVSEHLAALPEGSRQAHALVLARAARARLFGLEVWLLLLAGAVTFAPLVVLAGRPQVAHMLMAGLMAMCIVGVGETHSERETALEVAREQVARGAERFTGR